ncbi:hypothetical protein WJX72_012481 [[Myrmecia] bisecta]|uniref:SH3 domain-containing protein n=1 Tax=[Myrmecia] bisecta TaxID=41462 RepID=A0AAW1Q1Y6_9CHLO
MQSRRENLGHVNFVPTNGRQRVSKGSLDKQQYLCNEVYHSPAYGPTFGGGHDLCFFTSNFWNIGGSPNSFAAPSASVFFGGVDFSSADFTVEVLGVWTPSFGGDGAGYQAMRHSKTAASPHSVAWDKEAYATLASFLATCKPPGSLPQANLLLFGGVGAGKSSIVSSVDSLFKGRISRRAPHGQGTGSFTRILKKYTFQVDNLDAGTSKDVAWSLWDSAGWSDSDYQTGELGFILDGNLPDRFDLASTISVQSPGFNSSPMLADKVHCVCFVVPCESATDEAYIKRLQEMKNFARTRGIPTLVMLTKIDEYDPDLLGEDVTKTFESDREVTMLAGVGGTKDVFPVKSFSHEYEPQYEAGVLLFHAIKHALFAATDYISELPEPSSAANSEPVTVKAIADWQAEASDELSLKAGQLYIVEREVDGGWVFGKPADGPLQASGHFPKAYVEPAQRRAAPSAVPPRRAVPAPTFVFSGSART